MARFKTIVILLFSVLLASTFAQAQDPGTYRPGQPYNAVPATSSTVCDTQCQGDAACRGWNFVRTNPRQTQGICEFNSLAVDPIQSPVSVSSNLTQVFNSTGQNNIIPAGVRTTRIGSPNPQIQAPSAQKNTNQASSQRRIIRQPVPQQTQPQAATFRHSLGAVPQQLNRQQSAARSIPAQPRPQTIAPNNITRTHNGLPPRAPQHIWGQTQAQPQNQPVNQFRGQIQGQHQGPLGAQSPQHQAFAHSQADPRLQQQLSQQQSRLGQPNPRHITQTQPNALSPVQGQHLLGQPELPRQQLSAQPQASLSLQEQLNQKRPLSQAAATQIRSTQAQPSSPQASPRLQQAPTQAQVQAPVQARRGSLIEALTQPSAAPQPPQARARAAQPLQQTGTYQGRPLSVEAATQRSLYGHLNDDVSVPRQLSPKDLEGSDDLPIPTVTSVPVIPVDRESFTGLAGG